MNRKNRIIAAILAVSMILLGSIVPSPVSAQGSPAMEKSITVDLPNHKITVTQAGQIIRSIDDFSTGRQGHLTPIFSGGALDPKRRERMHYSTLYKDSHGKPAAMPFALFFGDDSGAAFHAGDPNLESHGCIHLTTQDAEWLFNWAGKDPVALDILGPNPHLVGEGKTHSGVQNASLGPKDFTES